MLTATLCLLAFGAVMVFSASSTTQVLSDGGLSNSAFFLKRTVLFGVAGLLIMRFLAVGGVPTLRRLTPALLGGSLFLLVIVLGIGSSANGAQRWIGSGFVQIQPSEIAKFALVLYGAYLLSEKPKRSRSIEGMLPYLLLTAFACLLIVMEPDLGSAIVALFAVAATLIAAGARASDLAKIAAVVGGLTLLAILFEPYRTARLTGFLHPGADAAGAGFQAAQAKIALGSGGIFGVGLGDGVQKAYYLPEAHTDMIAAVIGEELGMVGIMGLVGLFGLFGYAGFRTAQRAKDHYGKAARRRTHLADPLPGGAQPLRGHGPGAADRRPAPVRLLWKQQPAGQPRRRRPAAQHRASQRAGRRGQQGAAGRWQTAGPRWRAL